MQKQNHQQQQQQQQQQQIGMSGSQFRMSSSEMTAVPSAVVHQQQQQVVEEASPISSRPPAGNFDELGGDEDLVGVGSSGGNRWPRQETLALLKIRSEMDVAFRDANLKSPLWDQVSRKLGELGYTRSSKKCKEKFENVQKYYKRTKEGRAGRQDGKSYRFFSQLEALHGTTSIATTSNMTSVSPAPLLTANVAPISIEFGTSHPMPTQIIPPTMNASQIFPPGFNASVGPTTVTSVVEPHTAGGISFSSTSSSSGSESEDDDMDELHEADMSNAPGSHQGQKRKREKGGRSGTINNKMMEFFEGLMRQVMQKQEAMQQRFLETIEKREHDRMIRDEAWKRQEMSRLTREHELLAQDRAIAASRDASIIAFLQKITGQDIHLPTSAAPTPVATQPIPPPATTATTTIVFVPPQQSPPPPPPKRQHLEQQASHQLHISDQAISHQQSPINSGAFMAVPEQQIPPQDSTGTAGADPTSSRWPKIEVLALIKIRSGLETRYQEAGPKGPLWEDVSIGMQQMGYKRNAKRCKEKWENINKYFKKVKESNKSRPEDAKTCPYFHELDALYRRKVLGGSGTSGDGSSSFSNQNISLQQQNMQQGGIVVNLQEHERGNLGTPQQTTMGTEMEKGDNSSTIAQTNNGANLFGQGSNSAKNVGHIKPEDIMKGLIQQQRRQQHQLMRAPLLGKLDHSDEDEDENIDDESEEDMKMAYKIEFQPKQNAGNGTTSSFAAMVQ